ncbi:type I glutamate--ammonia ligase [Patescibacteria group bacterium]
MTTKNILSKIKKDKVKFVQLQFTDIFGVVKSVTISAKHLPDTLQRGNWFDGSSVEGFARIAESDLYLKPDLDTYAVIPWLQSEEGSTARFICDIHNPDGTPFAGDPRQILKQALAKAKKHGFVYQTGPEMEFYLFRKEDGQIKALPHDRGGYFDLTTDQAYNLRRQMALALEKFGIDVEATHHEVGRGQHEIDFQYADALRTADNATTLRFALKAIAQQAGLHVTFMPKPIAGAAGSGMHVHQSLFDIKRKKNAFARRNDKYGLSQTAYRFIAGQLNHAKALSAILSPTVNSYKRLVPGYEAPVYISWATQNRSALIRIPRIFKSNPKATRVELRSPDPSCNMYLAFATMLYAGLDGLQKKTKLTAPVEEDMYNLDDAKLKQLKIDMLPRSLWQALKALRRDKVLAEALGEFAYARYLEAKTKEWDESQMQVTKWELNKYLEAY